MSRKRTFAGVHLGITVLLILACMGAMLPVALTADDARPWRGEYFDNPSLTGQPVVIRQDAAINFDWENHRPAEGMPHDSFSVRWTAAMYFEGGRYSFKTYTDDGVRLWIDGTLLVDQWRNQPATRNEVEADVSAGTHSVRVEYYENIGNAVAMVWWDRLSESSSTMHWRAEYFSNPWLVGAPVVVRDEAEINQNWGSAAPVAGVGADGFSVRWSGNFGFDYTGNYTFTVTVDDGVRLWVDGGLLIDQWHDQSATFSAVRALTKGSHPITVEYYEGTGNASIQLSWTTMPTPTGATPSPTGPATGETIVDDTSSGFQKAGPSDSWYEFAVGYSGHIYWTYNSVTQLYNSAKWVPSLPQAGNYEVFAFIPKSHADTKSARYQIHHNGQDNAYVLDQSIYFDKWVSLGTYSFAANGDEYVYLDDVTGEAYASRKIGFDAVKFVGGASGTPVPTAVPTVPGPTAVPPTSVPPTAVPTTPVPTRTATPTPSPTPTLPACPITPLLGFGRIWSTYPQVRDRLGCPVETEKSTWSAEETFVNGYMFWRGDLGVIYSLFSDKAFLQFVDTWTSAEPEWDTTIVPPAGLYQPKRGFGKVWREGDVPPASKVRDKLSWATTEELGLMGSWQAYAGGLMLWSSTHGIFVLYYDNYTWEHYD
jgi:hypothetical protein